MRDYCRFGILLMLVMVIAACGQSTSPSNSTPLPTVASIPTSTPTSAPEPTKATPVSVIQTTSQAKASVRIVNAAPDAPILNMYVGFQAISTNLAFGHVTEITPIDGGDYIVKLLPIGSSQNDKPLLETNLTISGGDSLLLIITGSGEQLAITSLPDTIEPLNKGESIVRVIHTLTGIGAVTLQNDSSDLISPISFGQAANTAILPAGATTLAFMSDGNKLTDYSSDLQERKDYTLVLAGHSDSPLVISFTTPAPGRSSVRVINASQKINAVDFYLDDILLNGKVEFGRPTERQNMVSGKYTLNIYEAEADRNTIQPLVTQAINLDSDQNVALIFLGSADRFRVISYIEDLSPTAPGQARVAFVNTLDNLNSIHLETSGGPIPGVPDLIYGDSPTVILLDTGSFSFYTTAIDQNGVNNTVEVVTNLQFEPGLSYLYLITGRLDNNPIILSENVGTDSKLADVADNGGTPAPVSKQTQIRFINALQDQTIVDFRLNNELLLPGLSAGQGGDLASVSDSTPAIQVSLSGSNDPLLEADVTLSDGERSTVIAYGTDKTDVHVLVVPDSDLIFDGLSPHIRLINLSRESDNQLGLGFADSSQAPDITLSTAPDGDRPFIPNSVQQIIAGIGGGSSSSVILMPAGTFNLYVFDPNTAEVAGLFSNLTLTAGTHYDIIAYLQPGSNLVQVLVLPYPVRSD